MIKSPISLLLALIAALVVLALATTSSVVAALAIPLVVYLGVAAWHLPEKTNLSVERQVSSEWLTQDVPITVTLTVRNHGAALEEVLLRDPIPPNFRLFAGLATGLTQLAAAENVTLAYTAIAGRGGVNVLALEVVGGETFGLFQRRQSCPAPMHISVIPRFDRLSPLKIRPLQTRGFSGPIPSRQSGVGIDFITVREYQPGDAQQHLNWKLTARRPNELFTNTFEQERVADVGIILDSRYQTNLTSSGVSVFEHSVRATAALADSLLRSGNRVGLIIYGGSIHRVFPGYGRVQQERILRELAHAMPGLNYALEDLGYLPTRFFPSKSQVILVSPLIADDFRVLVRLRAAGYSVMLICPDVLALEADHSQSAGGDEAFRLARAERLFLLQRVRRIGVQVVDWRVNEPLDRAVTLTLARQPVQHRLGGWLA